MATQQKETYTDRDCSVVIPTYNRPQLAFIAAQTIRKFHKDIEITIIDQQSSSAIDLKETNKIGVHYINLSHINTSLAKNAGIKKSTGKIIFFFDDDVEITADTIPSHLKAYSDDAVVGTSGRVFNDGEEIPSNTDVETGMTNILGTKFSLQFWSSKEQYIDFPYGCNMSFKKEILEKVHGFDPNFPKIFEEIDLGIRISRNYGKIKFVPKALVYHHKASSGGTRTDPQNKQRMVYYHYGMYLSKNVPFPLSFISLALRTKTVLSEAPYAIGELWKGFFKYMKLKGYKV